MYDAEPKTKVMRYSVTLPKTELDEDDSDFDPNEHEYKCKFCSHKCATKSGIKHHVKRVHEGQYDPKDYAGKEYFCQFCNHSCGTDAGIEVHEKLKHEEETKG